MKKVDINQSNIIPLHLNTINFSFSEMCPSTSFNIINSTTTVASNLILTSKNETNSSNISPLNMLSVNDSCNIHTSVGVNELGDNLENSIVNISSSSQSYTSLNNNNNNNSNNLPFNLQYKYRLLPQTSVNNFTSTINSSKNNTNSFSNILFNNDLEPLTSSKSLPNKEIKKQSKTLLFSNPSHTNNKSIHFLPELPIINQTDISNQVLKTSLKKKRSSLSVLSDLFHYKLTPKAASVSAAAALSGEKYRKTYESIIAKESKKNNSNDKLKDKKKKRKKSYIKLLRKSNAGNSSSHHTQQEVINESIESQIQMNTSFTGTSFTNYTIDTQNLRHKNSKRQKKNRIKIKFSFNKLKNSKNNKILNKIKKIKTRDNNINQYSIHHSKSKQVNTSFTSSLHHQSANESSSSMEYKVSLRHSHTGRYSKNENIVDDPCYSFSEDVFNTLSNVDSMNNQYYSGIYQPFSYNQLQHAPSQVSSHSCSAILNSSNNYQNSLISTSLNLNNDNSKQSLQTKQPIVNENPHVSSRSYVLNEYSMSQQSHIPDISIESEYITIDNGCNKKFPQTTEASSFNEEEAYEASSEITNSMIQETMSSDIRYPSYILYSQNDNQNHMDFNCQNNINSVNLKNIESQPDVFPYQDDNYNLNLRLKILRQRRRHPILTPEERNPEKQSQVYPVRPEHKIILNNQNNDNSQLYDQNNIMVDQNNIMVDQNNIIVDQNNIMVDQNNIMVDQKGNYSIPTKRINVLKHQDKMLRVNEPELSVNTKLLNAVDHIDIIPGIQEKENVSLHSSRGSKESKSFSFSGDRNLDLVSLIPNKRISFQEEIENGHDSSVRFDEHSIESHCQSIYEKYRKLSRNYSIGNKQSMLNRSLNNRSSQKFSILDSFSHSSRSISNGSSVDKDISISISTTSSSSLDTMYLTNSNECYMQHSSSLRNPVRQSSFNIIDNINYSIPQQKLQSLSLSHEMSPAIKPISVISNSTSCSSSSSFERLASYDESLIFSSSSPQPPLLSHHASISIDDRNKDLRYQVPVFRNQSVDENCPIHRNSSDYGFYYCYPTQKCDIANNNNERNMEQDYDECSKVSDIFKPSLSISHSASSFKSERRSSYFSLATSSHSNKVNSAFDSTSLIIPELKLTTSVIPPSPTPAINDNNHLQYLNNENYDSLMSTLPLSQFIKSNTNLQTKQLNHKQDFFEMNNLTSFEDISVLNKKNISELENYTNYDLNKYNNFDNSINSSINNSNDNHLYDNNDVNSYYGNEYTIRENKNQVNHNTINNTTTTNNNHSNYNNDKENNNHKNNNDDSNNSDNDINNNQNGNTNSNSSNSKVKNSGDDDNDNQSNKFNKNGKYNNENGNNVEAGSNSSLNVNTNAKNLYTNNSSLFKNSPLIEERVIPTDSEDDIYYPTKVKDNYIDNNDGLKRKIEKKERHKSDQICGEVPLLKRLSFISLSKLSQKTTYNVNNENLEYSPLLVYNSLPRCRKSHESLFSNYKSFNAISTTTLNHVNRIPHSLSIFSSDSYRFEDDLRCFFIMNDKINSSDNCWNTQEKEKKKESLHSFIVNNDKRNFNSKNYYLINDFGESLFHNNKMPSINVIYEFLESYSRNSYKNNPYTLSRLIMMKGSETFSDSPILNDNATFTFSFDHSNPEINYPSLTYPLTSQERRRALIVLSLSLQEKILQKQCNSSFSGKMENKVSKEDDLIELYNGNNQSISPFLTSEDIRKSWHNKEDVITRHSISIKRLSNLSKRSFPSFLKTGESKTILTTLSGRIASIQTLFDENNDSKALEKLPSMSNSINNTECFNISVCRNDSHNTVNPTLHHITSVKTLCSSSMTGPKIKYSNSYHNPERKRKEEFPKKSTSLITFPTIPNQKNNDTYNVSSKPFVDKDSLFNTHDNNSFSILDPNDFVTPKLVSSPNMISLDDDEFVFSNDHSYMDISFTESKHKLNPRFSHSSYMDNSSEFHLFDKLSVSLTNDSSEDNLLKDPIYISSKELISDTNSNKSLNLSVARNLRLNHSHDLNYDDFSSDLSQNSIKKSNLIGCNIINNLNNNNNKHNETTKNLNNNGSSSKFSIGHEIAKRSNHITSSLKHKIKKEKAKKILVKLYNDNFRSSIKINGSFNSDSLLTSNHITTVISPVSKESDRQREEKDNISIDNGNTKATTAFVVDSFKSNIGFPMIDRRGQNSFNEKDYNDNKEKRNSNIKDIKEKQKSEILNESKNLNNNQRISFNIKDNVTSASSVHLNNASSSLLEYDDISFPSLSTINPYEVSEIYYSDKENQPGSSKINETFHSNHINDNYLDCSRNNYTNININDNINKNNNNGDINDNSNKNYSNGDINDNSNKNNNNGDINDNVNVYNNDNESQNQNRNQNHWSLYKNLSNSPIDNSTPIIREEKEHIKNSKDLLEYIQVPESISPIDFINQNQMNLDSDSLAYNSLSTVNSLRPDVNDFHQCYLSPVQEEISSQSQSSTSLSSVSSSPRGINKNKRKLKNSLLIFKKCTYKLRKGHNFLKKRNNNDLPLTETEFIQTNLIEEKPEVMIEPQVTFKSVKSVNSDQRNKLNLKNNLLTSLNESSQVLKKKLSSRSIRSLTHDTKEKFYCRQNNHSTNTLDHYIKSKLKRIDTLLVNKRKTFIEKDINDSSIIINDEDGMMTDYASTGFMSSIKNGKSLIFKDNEDEDNEDEEKYKNLHHILKDFDSQFSSSELNSSSREIGNESSISCRKLNHSKSQSLLKKELEMSHENIIIDIRSEINDQDLVQYSEEKRPENLVSEANEKSPDIKILQEKLKKVHDNQPSPPPPPPLLSQSQSQLQSQSQQPQKPQQFQPPQQSQKQQKIKNELNDDLQQEDENKKDILAELEKPEKNKDLTDSSDVSYYNPDLSVFRYPPISPNVDEETVSHGLSDIDEFEVISSIQPSIIQYTCNPIDLLNSKITEDISNKETTSRPKLLINTSFISEFKSEINSHKDHYEDKEQNIIHELQMPITTPEAQDQQKTISIINYNNNNNNNNVDRQVENKIEENKSKIEENKNKIEENKNKIEENINEMKEDKIEVDKENNKNEIKENKIVMEDNRINMKKNKFEIDMEDNKIKIEENENGSNKDISNSTELSSNKAIAGESLEYETDENESNIFDTHVKYLDDIEKDTQKYIIPNQTNSNHNLSHFTDKIVQKFKSELSLKKSKKSFISLKSKSSQSVILSPSISLAELSTVSSTPKSSINLSINQVNIDDMSQNQDSITKSYGIEVKRKMSKISLSDNVFWENLKYKNQKKVTLDATESNKNNKIYSYCSVGKIIPYLLTSNLENMNYIIHSINNKSNTNKDKNSSE